MQGKFYSYEACSTPPRNLCGNGNVNSPNQNFGEGDFVAGGYPSGGRPPIGAGPGPFPGNGGRPGSLGAILGVRTAGENGEVPVADENADPDKITFGQA